MKLKDSLIINILIVENINADSISRPEGLGASLLVFFTYISNDVSASPKYRDQKEVL